MRAWKEVTAVEGEWNGFGVRGEAEGRAADSEQVSGGRGCRGDGSVNARLARVCHPELIFSSLQDPLPPGGVRDRTGTPGRGRILHPS